MHHSTTERRFMSFITLPADNDSSSFRRLSSIERAFCGTAVRSLPPRFSRLSFLQWTEGIQCINSSAHFNQSAAVCLLVQSTERVRFDERQLVFVDGQNLERVQPLERAVVDLRDAVVVQVEDQQIVQVLEGARRYAHQLVLGHIELGKSPSWAQEKGKYIWVCFN